MKTVFITITRGSVIRNYFHTGIIKKLLERNVRVVALVPFYENKDLLKEFSAPNLIFEPLVWPKKIKFESLFIELFRGLIFNDTIRTYYKYKFLTYEPKYLYYYPRAIFYSFVKRLPGVKKISRIFDLYLNPQYESDYLFKKYKPDLVFCTTPHERGDVGVIKSARRFKVFVTGMPKSWDNLSKTLFPVKLDKIFVWSDYMKDEALRFQGYTEDEVSVVGIPQFDFYANKNLLLTREDFCQSVHLDPKKKIILYGSTGCGFDENGYLELVHKYQEEGFLKDIQVLMRPHVGYAGEMEKFDPLEKYEGFVVDRSDKQSKQLKDKWDISINHIKNLYNSLYHADVCVNIASTLTLDSTACGTPVVNICFDLIKEDFHKSIARVYETDYMSAVMSFRGTWVVRKKEDFLGFLNEALLNKNGKKNERKEILDYFICNVDGKSSDKLAEGIVDCLR